MSSTTFGIDIDMNALLKCETWAEAEAMIADAVRADKNKKNERERHNQDCSNEDMIAEYKMICETISTGLFRQTMELNSMKNILKNEDDIMCATITAVQSTILNELDAMKRSFIICATILGIAMVGILILLVIGGV